MHSCAMFEQLNADGNKKLFNNMTSIIILCTATIIYDLIIQSVSCKWVNIDCLYN